MKSQDSEPEQDPFLCTCGPCKRFWRDSFSESTTCLKSSPVYRAKMSSALSAQTCPIIHYGQRVLVQGKQTGAVRYVGFVDDNAIAPKLYVGVKLDDNVHSVHNGIFRGKRYFHCPPGHGAMVKYTDIRLLKAPEKQPSLIGNKMFPSWPDVCQRRRERNKKLEEIYVAANTPRTMTSNLDIKPPRISPRFSKTYYLRIGSTPQKIHCNDPDDIALRDLEKKKQEELAHLAQKEAESELQVDKQFRKWQQDFGGHEQADRMAETLRRLHLAYQEGLEVTRKKYCLTDESMDDA